MANLRNSCFQRQSGLRQLGQSSNHLKSHNRIIGINTIIQVGEIMFFLPKSNKVLGKSTKTPKLFLKNKTKYGCKCVQRKPVWRSENDLFPVNVIMHI